MFFKNIVLCSIFFLMLTLTVCKSAYACENCTIPLLGRDTAKTVFESKDKKWLIKYLFEQQDWKELPINEAHALHHDGHHVHNKTKEDFHHFVVGAHVIERISVSLDMPYVTRNSLEIEDHHRLGVKEQSKGWGDLSLIGNYHLLKQGAQELSLVGGIKLPTGQTGEKNSIGEKFEAELQPGTGSTDAIIGSVYNIQINDIHFLSNLAYVFKSQGTQHYQFGDVLSTSVFIDYLINPKHNNFKTTVGIHANYQYEQKHKDHGLRINDSGGKSIFLGPTLAIKPIEGASIFSSIIFPIYQNLGGAHQELDFTWTAGGKLQF